MDTSPTYARSASSGKRLTCQRTSQDYHFNKHLLATCFGNAPWSAVLLARVPALAKPDLGIPDMDTVPVVT